jgi:hypothetical protein
VLPQELPGNCTFEPSTVSPLARRSAVAALVVGDDGIGQLQRAATRRQRDADRAVVDHRAIHQRQLEAGECTAPTRSLHDISRHERVAKPGDGIATVERSALLGGDIVQK